MKSLVSCCCCPKGSETPAEDVFDLPLNHEGLKGKTREHGRDDTFRKRLLFVKLQGNSTRYAIKRW